MSKAPRGFIRRSMYRPTLVQTSRQRAYKGILEFFNILFVHICPLFAEITFSLDIYYKIRIIKFFQRHISSLFRFILFCKSEILE